MRSDDDDARDDLPLSISSDDASTTGGYWPVFTRELAARMSSNYWSHPAKRKCDAFSEFYAQFDIESSRRADFGEDPLTRPARATLSHWINACEDYFSWRSKYGKAIARSRY